MALYNQKIVKETIIKNRDEKAKIENKYKTDIKFDLEYPQKVVIKKFEEEDRKEKHKDYYVILKK